MKDIIILDLANIIIFYSIFGVAWLSNMVLNLYHNMRNLKEPFEIKRFFGGAKKAIILVLGTGLLVVAVDLFIYVSGIAGTEIGDMITITSILLTIGASTIKYIKKAFQTLYTIIDRD